MPSAYPGSTSVNPLRSPGVDDRDCCARHQARRPGHTLELFFDLYRLIAAGLALATVPLGPVLTAVQLTALFLVLVGLRVAEAR